MKKNNRFLENNSISVFNYIESIDLGLLGISFCERFDEKSRIWNFERHKHDFLEFIYFLDGRAIINVPEKKSTFR